MFLKVDIVGAETLVEYILCMDMETPSWIFEFVETIRWTGLCREPRFAWSLCLFSNKRTMHSQSRNRDVCVILAALHTHDLHMRLHARSLRHETWS